MFQFESMESRRLLSAVLSGTTLRIEGTASGDQIEVWATKNGKKLTASVNGENQSFNIRKVREITVDAFNGNDVISLSSKVTIRSDIEAGAGNDRVSGGSGVDDIDGGRGNDTLYGNAGNDELDGEAGNDVIFGGAGNDEIDGGTGTDSLTGNAGRDYFDDEDSTSEIVDFASEDRIDD